MGRSGGRGTLLSRAACSGAGPKNAVLPLRTAEVSTEGHHLNINLPKSMEPSYFEPGLLSFGMFLDLDTVGRVIVLIIVVRVG